jgi:uncharacterized protein YjgD (DUF1641 family)
MQEKHERLKLEETPEYIEKQSQIESSQKYLEGLLQEQKDLLKDVPDSTEEYEAVYRMVLGEMKEKGLSTLENITAKFRTKNEVNTRKVMEVLEGDMDNFFLLATIKQKDLKEFSKDTDYNMSGCVEEISKELVDISISLPE